MSLLTDTNIEAILTTNENEWKRREETKREKLLIANFDDNCLTPVGYDLRVGEQYLKMGRKIKDWNRLQENQELIIQPDEMIAIETEELIGMPQSKQYSGIIVAKVSVVEKGLSHISTSVDADYQGKLILTMSNESQRKITIKRKQKIATLIFFENKSPASRLCDKHPSEHVRALLEDWKYVGKVLKRKIYLFWTIKIVIPLCPAIWGLYTNYFIRPISEGEAALLAALISLLFLILDRVFRTE